MPLDDLGLLGSGAGVPGAPPSAATAPLAGEDYKRIRLVVTVSPDDRTMWYWPRVDLNGAGLDPINQLRTAIGLDRLRIVGADPALGRATGVAVGKNIGRRFYVEITSDGRGYSATEAEFRVTSWLSLLANVSTIGRESASLEISRDY